MIGSLRESGELTTECSQAVAVTLSSREFRFTVVSELLAFGALRGVFDGEPKLGFLVTRITQRLTLSARLLLKVRHALTQLQVQRFASGL